MNKNVRKYLRDIRSLFPKFGKKERKYLDGFKSMIEDCPDEESLSDRERREAAYGTPEEVVRGFFKGDKCAASGKAEDRYILKYISLARRKFPYISKPEEEYLQNKAWSIEDWFSEKELRNVDDIINVFGEPGDIYTEYLGLRENGSYLGRYRTYRRKRYAACACLLILTLVVTAVGQWVYLSPVRRSNDGGITIKTASVVGGGEDGMTDSSEYGKTQTDAGYSGTVQPEMVQQDSIPTDSIGNASGYYMQPVGEIKQLDMRSEQKIEGIYTNKNADVVIGYTDISNLKCSISDIRKITGLNVGTYRIDMPDNLETANAYLTGQLVEGNNDIDIFILYANTALGDLLDEEGICYPLNSSKIISEENEMMFDDIADGFKTESGSIWGIPWNYYMFVMAALPENMEKEGLSEDIFDDVFNMTDALKSLSLDYRNKKVYIMGEQYGLALMSSYIANNKGNTDYNSELFRNSFKVMWDGWEMYSQGGWGNHKLMGSGNRTVKINGKKTQLSTYKLARYFDEETTLFNMVTERDILNEDILPEGARIYPIPPISKEYKPECNVSMVMVINPNSRHKENALKVLEAVTEFNHQTGQLGVVYENISDYPDFYETDSDVFKQIYEINKNAVFSPGGIALSVWSNDIRPYQQKKTDLDTIIKTMQDKEAALDELIFEKTKGKQG